MSIVECPSQTIVKSGPVPDNSALTPPSLPYNQGKYKKEFGVQGSEQMTYAPDLNLLIDAPSLHAISMKLTKI